MSSIAPSAMILNERKDTDDGKFDDLMQNIEDIRWIKMAMILEMHVVKYVRFIIDWTCDELS